MKLGFLASLALGVSLLTAPAASAATIIDFTEVAAGTPLDGLTIKGVTFADNGGALIGVGGPGSVTYVNDPSSVAIAGEVTMTFAAPTNNLSFGMAFSSHAAVPNAASISLFDSGSNLIGTFALDALLVDPFAEGQFIYNGPSFIKTATITTNFAGEGYALDNITFDAAPPGGGANSVPLPLATWAGLALGASIISRRALRKV